MDECLVRVYSGADLVGQVVFSPRLSLLSMLSLRVTGQQALSAHDFPCRWYDKCWIHCGVDTFAVLVDGSTNVCRIDEQVEGCRLLVWMSVTCLSIALA